MKVLGAALLLLAAPAANAQTVPDIELGNPRVQTLHWEDGLDVLLTIMPTSGLTVMLQPGEIIQRVTVSDPTAFAVRVSPEGNSFLVLANQGAGAGQMQVETDLRSYPFTLRTGTGLTAAYLVRFLYDGSSPVSASAPAAGMPARQWSYRVRGDRAVLPQAITDDESRTFVTYAPDQALPAIFAIGQTGDEEMVNGYMRDDVFVIDRVYAELVFRLDEERATARRNTNPDG